MPWLEGGAKLIKANSDVVFEMHYNPNGREVTDHSEFGLYFAKSGPALRMLAIDTLRDLDLLILPGDRNYLSKALITLASPARLLSIQPHMHVRGASMRVSRRISRLAGVRISWMCPDTISIGRQLTFFRQPFDLPVGTRLESVARFDKSPNNPFNPDPAVSVRWGDQTTEEMHIAFLELVIDAKADPETLCQSAPKIVGTPVSSNSQ